MRGENESWYTFAYILIGAMLILFIFWPQFQRVRQMFLQQGQCHNPLNSLSKEIDTRALVTQTETNENFPIDLNKDCVLSVDRARICATYKDGKPECAELEHAIFSEMPPIQGQDGLTTIHIQVKKLDGTNTVWLTKPVGGGGGSSGGAGASTGY